MLSRSWKLCVAICAAGGLFAVAAAPAVAIGYYNVPGNFCQCFGYGNGAGHHACLVLGPSNCWGCCDHHEVRLACPPQPCYGCSSWGCSGCGYYGGDDYSPARFEPSTLPPDAGQGQPSPAAMRPQILR